MKLLTYAKDNEIRFGLGTTDGRALDVKDAAEKAGVRFQSIPHSTRDFIEGGERVLEIGAALLKWAEGRPELLIPLDELKLLAPIPNPRNLLLLAANYGEHIEEGGGTAPAETDLMTPRIFTKPISTLVGHREAVVLPKGHVSVDWEVELAVIIGAEGDNIAEADAWDHVFGYTVLNDISERKFYAGERTLPSPWDGFFDWLNGKWHDTFAPCGPYIVTKDAVGDPHDLGIRLWLNGEIMQDSTTRNMIHKIPRLVAFASRLMTLTPGDIIATGTPAGVGASQGLSLKAGDTLLCEIEGIGQLENPVRVYGDASATESERLS